VNEGLHEQIEERDKDYREWEEYYKRKQQERVARSEKVDGALSGVIKRM